MSAYAMFPALFFLTVRSVTSHARLAQVTFSSKTLSNKALSNKVRLLFDFSRVFQNLSLCEIMWKIKQSLFIYLSAYGSCHIRQA